MSALMQVVARAARCLAAIAALLPPLAAATPVELKLAFFASEQTETFRYGVKPFVDAVNSDGEGIVTIKVYPEGRLGKSVAEQAQMLLTGVADIAWVVPGQTPYRFPDNEVLEMPGLFSDVREGTLVYTRLIAAGALRGYQDFFVIGAFGAAPGIIHGRRPIGSLADLKNLHIRTNNAMEAEAVARFGAIPTIMPVSMVAEALSRGTVDAAIVSPTGILQFGAAAAKHHYLLTVGSAPLVLLMSRARFEALPAAGQALIRRYSGERAAATWIDLYGQTEQASLDRIRSDADRRAVEPSAADQKTAQGVYRGLIQAWAAKSPENARLVAAVQAELAAIRAGQR